MIKFPDVNPSFSMDWMRGKYFDKLDRYLRAVSYGKAWVTGKMTEWYTLPHPVGRYRISPHNLKVERGRLNALIQDALNLADPDEAFSRYSMIFISLGARRTDFGMAGLCGYPGMLGWESRLPIKTKRGQSIPGGVAIYCEEAHVGVVFHDMAHIMGGVQRGRRVMPCLYDHDLQAQPGPFRDLYQFYLINVGFFDPMSCHMIEREKGPPGVCAFTKLRLNWVDPKKIVKVARGESKTVLLGPLSSAESDVQVVHVPINATTYYLIENRQPIGPDANLPSHGILIYYCDDEVAECRRGASPVKLMNADPSVPELKGAPFTPEGKNSFLDEKHRISVKLVGREGQSIRVVACNGQ